MYSARSFLFTLIALSAAFYFGIKYTADKSQADNSLKWQRVSAVVQNVNLTHTASRRSYTYYPHVNYQFEANGHSYLNNKIAFPDPTFNNEQDAQKFLDQYKEGSLVSVYYDLKAPGSACLKPGVTNTLNGELLFGFLLVGAAALFALIPSRNDDSVFGYGYYPGGRYQGPQGYITPSR